LRHRLGSPIVPHRAPPLIRAGRRSSGAPPPAHLCGVSLLARGAHQRPRLERSANSAPHPHNRRALPVPMSIQIIPACPSLASHRQPSARPNDGGQAHVVLSPRSARCRSTPHRASHQLDRPVLISRCQRSSPSSWGDGHPRPRPSRSCCCSCTPAPVAPRGWIARSYG
jgi:hypothetical protein